jgi:hypothetical protein
MDPLSIGLIVFACVFGGALFGMFLGSVLPKEHLSPDARDVIKVSMAMVATLAALVLGLLTASAKSGLDDKEGELRSIAAQVILLNRTMAEYGPETAEARDLLKQILVVRINQIWPEENAAPVTPEAIGRGTGIEGVQEKLLALSPKNDAQRWLQSTALQTTRDIAAARWAGLEQIGSSIQWPFLVVVVFWLAIIFASFGLFAPRNASVTAALFVAALSVAGSIYLILEMDQPYRGLIKLSSTPLRIALEELGGS